MKKKKCCGSVAADLVTEEEKRFNKIETRSLWEGLEARLRSSGSAALGHSCHPLPANSRSWDIVAEGADAARDTNRSNDCEETKISIITNLTKEALLKGKAQ
jgi:hypothetical protein